MEPNVELRLFPLESLDFITIMKKPVLGLFFPDRGNLVANLIACRDIHNRNAGYEQYIAYGQCGECVRPFVAFNADSGIGLQSLLESLVAPYNGGWLMADAHSFQNDMKDIVAIGPEHAWDGTRVRFCQLVNEAVPGLEVKGYCPRGHLYIAGQLKRYS